MSRSGEVLEQIEGLGLRERTLVVVAGDHGEAMGEHDEKTHVYFVYDGTIRVPLLFWGATVPRGLKVESLVRTVDVTPTILDMLELPPLEGVQGTSLLPLMKGESLDLELVGYGESIEPHIVFGASVLRFVRKGQWKYIHKVEPELFDLTGDPGELENLSSVHPEVVERLRAELSALIERRPNRPPERERRSTRKPPPSSRRWGTWPRRRTSPSVMRWRCSKSLASIPAR